VLGAYYQHDNVVIPGGPNNVNAFDIKTPPLDILLNYHTPKTTEAAFGQGSFDITDSLQLVVGARYTHSTFDLQDTTSLLIFGLPGAAFGDPPESVTTSQNDDKVTGKIALNWKLDANNFLYAFVATGHKPGGINTTPLPFGPGSFPVFAFAPEDLTDYEIGWKPTFYDGHVRAQLGAFYTTYQNFQLTYGSNLASGAPGQSVIRNVPGTTVIYGVEASAQATFGDWSWDVSGDYLHARLGSMAGTCSPTGGTSPSCVGGPVQYENIGGAVQPYAPEWSFNIGVQYAFHLGDGSTLTPRVNYGYIASQWTSPFQALPVEQYAYHLPAINLVNAQIQWDKDKLHLALYGTNLLNTQYFIPSAQQSPPAGPIGILRVAAPPLQFGVRASRDF
jgi:iron complex outermembrane receptor protein